MAQFSFADRYADAGISPTAQVIADRQAPAERIVASIKPDRIVDLAGAYYGSPGVELGWMRDEFAEEDASFSLVNNEREVRVLAATILGSLVASGKSVAILAVLSGNVVGHRPPVQSGWLLDDAVAAFGARSVADRKPAAVDTKVVHTAVPKLAEEIAAVPQNDWASLLAVLVKIRNEAQSSARTTSGQATNALAALDRQVRYMREESQMLWWLVGGHSRSLGRGFSGFGPQQAALVAAADLGSLTSVSPLGPVAAPAMLERVIDLARRPRGAQPRDLASAVDGLSAEDLEGLPLHVDAVPARLAPVTAAVSLARTMGVGAWHGRFKERTGLDASTGFEPVRLAEQLYREHLLGQLL